jgi:hypothetical protein
LVRCRILLTESGVSYLLRQNDAVNNFNTIRIDRLIQHGKDKTVSLPRQITKNVKPALQSL